MCVCMNVVWRVFVHVCVCVLGVEKRDMFLLCVCVGGGGGGGGEGGGEEGHVLYVTEFILWNFIQYAHYFTL